MNNKKNGFGIEYLDKDTYEGEFIDDIFNGKCKAQIKFFSTLSMAKRAFSASFGKIWDEELQCFRNRGENHYSDRYVIKEVKVTYDFS